MADKAYTDVHRMFLQNMMSCGILSAHEAKEAVGRVFELSQQDQYCNGVTMLGDVIAAINARLQEVGLELRWGTSEMSGEKFVVLVNREVSELSKLVPSYSVPQIALLTRVISKIAQATQGRISTTEFVNESLVVERMGLQNAEEFMRQLLRDKFIVEDNGYVALHVRAITELEPVLKEKFGMEDCTVCRKIVVIAEHQSCPTCFVRVHSNCLRQLRSADVVCPNRQCAVAWPWPLAEAD